MKYSFLTSLADQLSIERGLFYQSGRQKTGVHTHIAWLVQMFQKYKADVWLSRDGQTVNGRSIMGVLTLAAAKGDEVDIRAEGADAEQVIEAARTLFANRFGEEI